MRKTIRNYFKKETIRKNNLFEKTIGFFSGSGLSSPPPPRCHQLHVVAAAPCAARLGRATGGLPEKPGERKMEEICGTYMENQWERYGFMETYVENHYLVGGLEHCLFFHNMWDVIIPTDELIFFRGVGQPPASYIFFFNGKTTGESTEHLGRWRFWWDHLTKGYCSIGPLPYLNTGGSTWQKWSQNMMNNW